MLNKNDPLIGAVKQIMQQSDAERAAVKAVNEKFGIQDRKALPWQQQSEWDATYKKVLSEGVSVLNEETQLDEISTKLARNYIKKANDQRSSGKLTIGQAGKRTDGVELATRKLTGAGGYPRAKVLTKEEQIDELSRGTLERYVNKAGDQAGRAAVKGALGDKEAQKTFKKRLKGVALIAQKEKRGAIKEEEQIDEIADTARGKERVRLAVHRADATVVDSAINPPRSKKGKREAKNAMKTIDRGINVHKKKGGVLDSYLKRAYGLKKEETVEQHPSIESIQEEIANSLMERAKSIHETQGEAGLQAFFESLTEEQIAILQMNEGFGGDQAGSPFDRLKKWLGFKGAPNPTPNPTTSGSRFGGASSYQAKDASPSKAPAGSSPTPSAPAKAASSGPAGPNGPNSGPSGTHNTTAAPPPKAATPPVSVATKAKAQKTAVHKAATKTSGIKAPVKNAGVKATVKSRLQSRYQRDSEVGPRR